MKSLGMKPESKNTVSGTQKLVAVFGILFCTVVAVLLVVLYYPADSGEKEFEDFERVTSVGSSKDWDLSNEDASKTRVEEVARALEDFGAAFLALLAVCCVTVGLSCLFCACCVLK